VIDADLAELGLEDRRPQVVFPRLKVNASVRNFIIV
jgi:hypothetical protein